ncbi:hypothetical protein YC2023_043790 [Brassica napus]
MIYQTYTFSSKKSSPLLCSHRPFSQRSFSSSSPMEKNETNNVSKSSHFEFNKKRAQGFDKIHKTKKNFEFNKSSSSLLLDCGEGADEVVRKQRCIWISHIHADHHAALRSKILRGVTHEPAIVVGPRPLKGFLDAYIKDLGI